MSEPTLFPELDREVAENLSAIRRQAAQVVRHQKRKALEYLKGRDFTKLVNRLLDKGPATESAILSEIVAADEFDPQTGWNVLVDLWCLWRVGKLWRVSQGIHQGSGEESFLYGIRKVHQQPQ